MSFGAPPDPKITGSGCHTVAMVTLFTNWRRKQMIDPLHIQAINTAQFVGFMVLLITVDIWRQIRKEK